MRLSQEDPNSYSTPENVIIRHIDIDWRVNFVTQILSGTATLQFDILAQKIENILLDVSDINITSIDIKTSGGEIPVNFFVSDHVEDIGSKLTIDLPTETSGSLTIVIAYETTSKATALQWLTPEQTLGKNHPYLFSQCQAIHARSILPCQDTPAVKFTYNATIRYPEDLTGLMSAIIVKQEPGMTKFEQTVPIPSYLLAIAVGKLVSRPLGPISAVWGEEQQIDAAAFEFSETSEFLKVASEICGPYVWKRYDLLLMPPSFPFGGMENPCLTFVTPTLLAGDRSLADVIAHEISHSWTGNLVTNKNFEHFWLNEGFTVFVEGKIVGKMRGAQYRDFHSILGLGELTDCIKTQLADTPELTKLVVDLSNLGPDDAFSSVPYIKGSTFLRYVENTMGGPEVFDPFLRFYLNKYKYQSIVTNDLKKTFYDYFKDNENHLRAMETIDWDMWMSCVGMPPIIPDYDRTLSDGSLRHAELWAEKSLPEIRQSRLITESLSSEQKIEFLTKLLEKTIVDLNAEKVALLGTTYAIHSTKNAEIQMRYMRICIKARLSNKLNDIITFANSNFRMKFVRPIYRELADWPEGKIVAIENFERVRNQMMKVCSNGVAKDLGIRSTRN